MEERSSAAELPRVSYNSVHPSNSKTIKLDFKEKSKSLWGKITFQTYLILWKRFCELKKSKSEIAKLFVPFIFFFALVILFYSVFLDNSNGEIEFFFIPIAFWVFAQKVVVNITYEKSNKLFESMKTMGLLDVSYWIANFIFDAVLVYLTILT